MNTNIDFTNTKKEPTAFMYCPNAYATLFNKGLERVVEVSRASFDFAMEQNTEVFTSCNKALKASSMPSLFFFNFFNLAGEAVERYATLQKRLLGMAIKQSTLALSAARECGPDASNLKAEVARSIPQSVDCTVSDQKPVVSSEAKQMKASSAAIKQQPGIVGKPVARIADPIRQVDSLPANEIAKVATLKQQPSVTVKPVETIASPAQRGFDTLPGKEIVKVVTVQQQLEVVSKPAVAVSESVQRRVDTLLAKEIVDLAIKPMKPAGPSSDN